MKVYFGIKYYEDCRNRLIIEQICAILENYGYEMSCVIRDMEKWGAEEFPPDELMKATFEEIDSSNIVMLDLSEKGVGLGIEAGYAYAKGIPVVAIAKKGSDISNTMLGIANQVIIYEKLEDIEKMFFG
ncbi:nucleoside 2-deoxyribosyltransferase [Desulfosporosinus sp. BICA1-9]|uniref:nucleoside 2-deoxyribosyltransferase n=1 Tax=Desulfosporosinus sp. BICA1-9 TaxID=1531958 RepID=UPI00054C1BB0|nr:nucleoside 2-deoxyribosyltransferase [Desulfosporosinus sp. BICA1-9]KJS46450.1 MAG: nucleoside 2-deoxyribosyltransferase [Peptococcaceae bacterium BRH_c23]KJS86374.1 MAG: nucleoside 2-deoxyribosyltransferase [Desulfosporosinus sp. BICA1-9]HBW35626.1 nucleoside 2-deoxyribosyltransferase [Desulfosporosinus sp.]